MQRKPTKRYWRALGQLYGNQVELGEPIERVKPKRAKPECPTEFQEQIVAATWLSKMNIPFYHVANGGYRDAREAAKFKRMGVRAGVPDICIPVARKSYHGLYIELKRVSGGSLSDLQKVWRDILIREGYAWYEAKGAEELIRIVQEYLNVSSG